jgi:hypothetical protein
MVYGTSLERARALREMRGGRLKTSIINGHVYPPLNSMNLSNANPNRYFHSYLSMDFAYHMKKK